MYRKEVAGHNGYSPCLQLAGPGLQRSCMVDQQLTQIVKMDESKNSWSFLMDMLLWRRSVLIIRGRNAMRAVVPENIFDKSERLTATCLYCNHGPIEWIYLRYSSVYLFISLRISLHCFVRRTQVPS